MQIQLIQKISFRKNDGRRQSCSEIIARENRLSICWKEITLRKPLFCRVVQVEQVKPGFSFTMVFSVTILVVREILEQALF